MPDDCQSWENPILLTILHEKSPMNILSGDAVQVTTQGEEQYFSQHHINLSTLQGVWMIINADLASVNLHWLIRKSRWKENVGGS